MTIEKSKRPSLSEKNDAVLASTEEEFLADEDVDTWTAEEIEEDEVLKELYSTEPIGTRVKVQRDGTEINPLKGKSGRPPLSADDDAKDLGANHAEGSALKDATGARPIVFDY